MSRTIYFPWGGRHDQVEKASYDGHHRDISDTDRAVIALTIYQFVGRLSEKSITPSERAFLVTAIGLLGVMLVTSGCTLYSAQDAGHLSSATAIHNPTLHAPHVDIHTLTPPPAGESSKTLKPENSRTSSFPATICSDSVKDLNLQGNQTELYGNPGDPQAADQLKKVTDAGGNPILPDIQKIIANGAAAGLTAEQVAVGTEKNGGYFVVFKYNGNYINPQIQDAGGNWVPASRPDASGQISTGKWDVVPQPPVGTITPWMQAEATGSCAYLAATVTDPDTQKVSVVGEYSPLRKTWLMETQIADQKLTTEQQLGIKKTNLVSETQSDMQAFLEYWKYGSNNPIPADAKLEWQYVFYENLDPNYQNLQISEANVLLKVTTRDTQVKYYTLPVNTIIKGEPVYVGVPPELTDDQKNSGFVIPDNYLPYEIPAISDFGLSLTWNIDNWIQQNHGFYAVDARGIKQLQFDFALHQWKKPETVSQSWVYQPEIPKANDKWDGVGQVWINPEYTQGQKIYLSQDADQNLTQLIEMLLINSRNQNVLREIRGKLKIPENQALTVDDAKQYLESTKGLLPEAIWVTGVDPKTNENIYINTGPIDLKKPVEYVILNARDPDFAKIKQPIYYENSGRAQGYAMVKDPLDGHLKIYLVDGIANQVLSQVSTGDELNMDNYDLWAGVLVYQPENHQRDKAFRGPLNERSFIVPFISYPVLVSKPPY